MNFSVAVIKLFAFVLLARMLFNSRLISPSFLFEKPVNIKSTTKIKYCSTQERQNNKNMDRLKT